MESLQLALHPPRQAAQAALDAPSFPGTVRLYSSVCLSLSQHAHCAGVWKLGLVLLIQIKAVSWAISGCSDQSTIHWVPFKQQTWVPPSLGGWKFKIRQIPWPVRAVFSLCHQRTGKLLTTGRSSLSVYVSELKCDPMSLSRIIKLIDSHRETQKAASGDQAHTESLTKDGRWRWPWR